MDNLDEKFNNYIKYVEENNKIQNTLNKIITYLCIIVLGFGVGFFLRKCSKTEPIKVNTKDIRNKIDDIDSVISVVEPKKDSIVKQIKPLKSIGKKKASYFVPTNVNCTFDSVKYLNRIDSLLSLCNKLDTVYQIDSTLIKLLKTQIKQYQKLDTNWQCRYDSLSVEYDKASKKYYWKGFKHGFYTGNVTGFGGSLLLRK